MVFAVAGMTVVAGMPAAVGLMTVAVAGMNVVAGMPAAVGLDKWCCCCPNVAVAWMTSTATAVVCLSATVVGHFAADVALNVAVEPRCTLHKNTPKHFLWV